MVPLSGAFGIWLQRPLCRDIQYVTKSISIKIEEDQHTLDLIDLQVRYSGKLTLRKPVPKEKDLVRRTWFFALNESTASATKLNISLMTSTHALCMPVIAAYCVASTSCKYTRLVIDGRWTPTPG